MSASEGGRLLYHIIYIGAHIVALLMFYRDRERAAGQVCGREIMAVQGHLHATTCKDKNPVFCCFCRSPAAVARELSQLQLPGVAADTSYKLHVERWTQTMLESLRVST